MRNFGRRQWIVTDGGGVTPYTSEGTPTHRQRPVPLTDPLPAIERPSTRIAVSLNR
ncbi:hypothetical protein SAMN04490220_8944 [Rhodococcus jostii]|uniref:Uncharacterized protein n=1 Tax=Rhodococcus jostii TaxID=132919 RepID=A0A1H5MHI8_RHOJO|nr:hypothetical protein SAMN04490220_8944 [Rhodococcus jostii]